MWTFYQTNGLLISADGLTTLHCYAGIDEGKNNPAMQHVKNTGPLPCGRYTAMQPVNTERHGPFAMHLFADEGNDMKGRDSFMYHADSIAHPGEASNGCIVSIGAGAVSGRQEREIFWNSGDHEIEVKSGLGD